ncbi:hypothetical protein G6F70_003883 [Rhizopus microsporus]|nr:hypothetical protein G6F71_003882 [Rhizopus microsporus]KAG1200643.1 hypothetical protein G6F70_003883 [Rhizopus microsporus]KAG1216445.1 hypothetical protein G6F69_000016 [Rhizopus microsporus]KAG1234422.1 hypothetical protein G6F67_003548 [Rhizopus microsporus]KAG1266667.1 hypothetical protein G6F68_002549 [Rhizopus microsporus]
MTTVEPEFKIYQETHMFMTEPIHFQVTVMRQSVFIWVGKEDGKLGDLSMAVPPFASHTVASSTSLLGKSVSEESKNLARKLAKRYKQQFYVSFNLNQSDDMLFVFVEKKLMEILKTIF